MNQALSAAASSAELIGKAADDYFAAISLGERPSIEEFARRYPTIADHIRRAFPALVLVGPSSPGRDSFERAFPGREKTLGDFRLIRELGRGGMGTVYEAEQISLGRHVALKVLPFAALANDKSLQRFRNEVRAAAALDHPHIVAVYSVGEDRGVHYYSMQLIRGQTVATLVSDLQRSRQPGDTRGSDPSALTIDQNVVWEGSTSRLEQGHISTLGGPRQIREYYRGVARLGIEAAQALQHAHDQGVLHRDIKPSNLLLDAAGTVYITDFDLARIEADTGLTLTGDIVGTLRYMAPEQALAKRIVIDHRVDIYSLSATLYELLSLQPAFGETDREELLKQIAFGSPHSLRSLDRRIPLPLEIIIGKGMSASPDDRYQTMQHLADDLRAFVEDRPINAKPPSVFERTARWSRRHRTIAASIAAAIMFAATVSLISGILLAVAFRNERHHRANAEQAAAEAHRQRVRAEQVADESGAIRDFLANDLLRAPGLEITEGKDITVGEILVDAEAKIGMSLKKQPAVEGAVRLVLADTFTAIGKYDQAEVNARRALTLLTDSYGLGDERTSKALTTLVSLLGKRQRASDARKLIETSLAERRRQLGDDHPATLRAMMSLLAHLSDCDVLLNLYVRDFSGMLPRSEVQFLESTTVQDKTRFVPFGKKTLELSQRLCGPEHPDTLHAMLLLGVSHRVCKQPAQAYALYQEALTIARRVEAVPPGLIRALTTSSAIALAEMGHHDEALVIDEELAEENRRLNGVREVRSLEDLLNLSLSYEECDRIGDACRVTAEGIDLCRKYYGVDHLLFTRFATRLTRYYREQNKQELAIPIWAELLESQRRTLGPGHPMTVRSMWRYGEALATTNQEAAANKIIDEAINNLPADEAHLREMLAWHLATFPNDEVRDGRRALKLALRVCELTEYSQPSPIDTLAGAYAEVGDFEQSVKWSHKAVDMVVDDPVRLRRFKRHLDSFKNGKPWRQ